MHASDDLLKLDQDELQTVIPSVGGRVRIVNGEGRGEEGVLDAIDEKAFCVRVRLDDGSGVVERLEYEDVCKVGAV
jgi:DNA/RNA-binding protein KIN17